MKTQELSALLDKYYKGETSDEEETLLKKVFSEASVPPELESEKEIFNFYVSEGEVPLPSQGFENRIIASIDDLERDKELKHRRRILYSAISSAAALLLLIGSYFFFIQKSDQVDTFSDPAVAYAETMKILMDVSSRLNKGTSKLTPIGKLSGVTEKSIEKITESSSLMNRSFLKVNHIVETVSSENKTDTGSMNK
ncbi:MAG TPA: hypothetical protein VMV47_18260 [Bacteroidales bacterium]|nr:hypothetical protein [Bacteroidales bacterium]